MSAAPVAHWTPARWRGRTVGGWAYLSLAARHLLQRQLDGLELGGQRVHRLMRHVALLVQPLGLRKQTRHSRESTTQLGRQFEM